MVTVVGLGFVGLTTALGFAEYGHKVYGIEVNEARMNTIRSGNLPFLEPGLDEALKDAGVKFDFIGFDACLMATAETALMLAEHADYLIASEETEPGVGWYYTDWPTALGKNPSMPTIEIGRNIVDSFVETCAQKCRGQLTTLSVIDLAELEATLPQALADFSRSTSRMIEAKEYQTVSNARNEAREFAQSSKIDQVDLVHLAKNLGTQEGEALAAQAAARMDAAAALIVERIVGAT